MDANLNNFYRLIIVHFVVFVLIIVILIFIIDLLIASYCIFLHHKVHLSQGLILYLIFSIETKYFLNCSILLFYNFFIFLWIFMFFEILTCWSCNDHFDLIFFDDSWFSNNLTYFIIVKASWYYHYSLCFKILLLYLNSYIHFKHHFLSYYFFHLCSFLNFFYR